jgi:hypothetical protein
VRCRDSAPLTRGAAALAELVPAPRALWRALPASGRRAFLDEKAGRAWIRRLAELPGSWRGAARKENYIHLTQHLPAGARPGRDFDSNTLEPLRKTRRSAIVEYDGHFGGMLMMNAYPRWSLLAVPLLAALGCSDPVPPPAQAAVSLQIGQPLTQVNGMSCPQMSGHTYHVGAFDSKTMKALAPTTTDPGQSLISGESGSTISCSVTGGGGNFRFSGSIHAATDEGDLISVSFANGVITGGSTGTADVDVYTPELSADFGSTMPCTFQILTGSDGLQIKGGSMWASFACPSISSPPSGLCGILQSQSVVVFENCSGS